jgi:tetratricopeptide (TPR) repeat protein
VRLELEEGWRTYVKDPQVYRRLTYVLQHLADDPSRAGADGKLGKQQAHYLTQQLVLALHAEKHEDAIELVERLGNDVQPQVFRRMQTSYPFGVARMYAYHQFDGDLAKLLPLAELPRNDPEKARQWLAGVQAIAKRNREPAARPYFDDVLRRAQMEVDFHDGKWVDLTFDPALSDWDFTPGQWTYESERSAIASSVGSDFGFRCFHHCQFAGPREIICDIDVIESFVPYLFLGIYQGNFSEVGAMFWIEQARKQLGAAKWGADKLPYLHIPVPKLDRMHVRIWGAERVELYGNGSWQSFVNEGEEYNNDPEQLVFNRVGFGAMWCRTSTSIVRFSNVRVHKLGPPPPELGADNNQEIIAYYDRELESNPDFAYAYFYRGLAKGNLKQYAAAIPDYERGLALVPSALVFRGMMGSALCQTGKYSEGIKNLERASTEGLAKKAPITNYLLAYTAYFLATAPDEKLRDGDRAVELATKSCAATKREKFYPLLALAVAQAEQGQFDAALATIDEASPLVKSEKSKAALARCRQSLAEKKPWRYNLEKAEEDIYWIGSE